MTAIGTERFADVGELRLCHQTIGPPEAPPVLMVMGLGSQMVWWDDELCAMLAARGLRIIRFDNRDIGRSTILHDRAIPSTRQLVLRDRRAAAYTLDDMAGDAAGLLDALGIESAHVVGASMGGMIGQLLAIRHPERVRSLVSIMSTTGNRRVGRPAPRTLPLLLRRPRQDHEGYVADVAATLTAIGSRRHPPEPERLRALGERCWERGHDRSGVPRQLLAIQVAADRTAALGSVRAPTAVIHGTEDELIRPSGGRATATAIPGARLIMLEGMAHDMPQPLWPRIVEAIADTVTRGEQG